MTDFKSFFRKFRPAIVSVIVGAVLMSTMLTCSHIRHERERKMREAESAAIAAEHARQHREDSLMHIRHLQQERQDSIRRAQRDSIAATLPPVEEGISPEDDYTEHPERWNELHPNHGLRNGCPPVHYVSGGFYDMEQLVRSVAKENYYAAIWLKKTDVFIMHYSIGEGKREKDYLREFNAKTRRFKPAIRVTMPDANTYVVKSNPSLVYRQEKYGTLVLYKNGKEIERWNHWRLVELDTPETDGYEDHEDYWYDNEEDLRRYYGR